MITLNSVDLEPLGNNGVKTLNSVDLELVTLKGVFLVLIQEKHISSNHHTPSQKS